MRCFHVVLSVCYEHGVLQTSHIPPAVGLVPGYTGSGHGNFPSMGHQLSFRWENLTTYGLAAAVAAAGCGSRDAVGPALVWWVAEHAFSHGCLVVVVVVLVANTIGVCLSSWQHAVLSQWGSFQ